MTRNNPFKTAVLSATVGALTILAAPSVSAQEIKFAYRQYELQSSEGSRQVYTRMMKKVRSVCNNWANVTIAHQLGRRACVADLSNQLVTKIDDPRIAALHDADYAKTRFASRQ